MGLKVVNGIVDEAKAKNTYSNRKIIISQACIDLLKEYKAWQDDYKKKIGKMWKNEIESSHQSMELIFIQILAWTFFVRL